MTQAVVHSEKSTNVRSETRDTVSHALRWSRAQIAMRALVSPAFAASYATELFFTPRRFAPSDAEFELLATARPFRVGRIAAWQWGEGPVVLLAHGWEGRGSQLGPFVQPLLARGYSVVTFDAPAHGVSPGELAAIPDFARALDAVARAVGPVHAVVAHSMGSLGALLAMQQGLAAKALVTIGAPSPSAAFAGFSRVMELSERVEHEVRERIVDHVGISFAGVEPAALAAGVRTPALVVHDRTDREAALSNSESLAATLPGATLMVTEGLGHRRILRDEDVVRRVVDFIAR